jgi:carboxymethylenebutenolidase
MADVTTIEMHTPAGPIDALLSIPEGQGPWPGVVVVHDIMGYGPDKQSISDNIAAAGYIALTPNLFARGGWRRCVIQVFRELLTKRGRALDDILAARDHLLFMSQCSGRVGIAGFCMGGGFALVMSPSGFGASAPFYGTPLPRNLSETLEGACPIVASFGGHDPMGIGAPKRLHRVLQQHGVINDVKVYSRAGHSFANRLPAQPLLRPRMPGRASSRFSSNIWGATQRRNAPTSGRPGLHRRWARLDRPAPSQAVPACIVAGRSSIPTLFSLPPRSLLIKLNIRPCRPYRWAMAS